MSRARLVSLVLVLTTLVLYLPVRQHSFILYDDPDYITENATVQAGITWTGLRWAFTTLHASNWHPVTWVSHMLDCELFGLDAGAHHMMNAALHAANALLVLFLLLRTTGALWTSALVAALFAWHPLHIQSVAWAAERKDVLSTLFGLLAAGAYIRYAETFRSNRSNEGKKFWLGLSVLCYALSLLSKPMLVTLPFALLLLDFWPLGRFGTTAHNTLVERRSAVKSLVMEKLPFFLLSAGSCVITFIAQKQQAVVALESHSFSMRIGNAVLAYGRYLLKTFWPIDLAIIYPLENALPTAWVAVGVSLLGGISLWAWRLRKERPHLLFGWLWFLGTLVPVIGLVQVGAQSMADRYTYVPLIGIFSMVAFEGRSWAVSMDRRRKVWGIVTGIALGLCLVCASWQLRYWRDSETLFARALSVTPDNATARVNLGMAYEQQGNKEKALTQYQRAVALDPNLAQAHNNLANLLDESGDSDGALTHYREALRLKPAAYMAQANLGTLLSRLGRLDEALPHFDAATRIGPRDPRPHYLKGKALLRAEQPAEAFACFQDALALDPNHLQSLVHGARLLASNPKDSVRNGRLAEVWAKKALAISGGDHPLILDTLAMAFAENRQFKDAVEAEQKAIELSAAVGGVPVDELRERLALYQEARPFRQVTPESD